MKIVDYKMLTADTSEILSASVKRNLSDGWELYGSPYSTSMMPHNQAMVKYKENNKKEKLND